MTDFQRDVETVMAAVTLQLEAESRARKARGGVVNEQMQRDMLLIETLVIAWNSSEDIAAWQRIRASMLADEQTKERPVIAPPSKAAATADERFGPAPAGVSEAGHIDLLPPLKLPPLRWIGVAPTPDGRLISLASEDSIEARERILMARIAELEADAAKLDASLHETIKAALAGHSTLQSTTQRKDNMAKPLSKYFILGPDGIEREFYLAADADAVLAEAAKTSMYAELYAWIRDADDDQLDEIGDALVLYYGDALDDALARIRGAKA